MKKVIVLGGGVCGLYAALKLARAGVKVTVIEKAAQPGGIAGGFQRGENFYDLGVHMLHAFDQEIFADMKGLMGEERIEVPLNARIKWAGKLYHYPLRGRDILAGIPPLTLTRCLIGLVIAEISSRIKEPTAVDAEGALVELYGSPLYEFFFEEFTHRYWGIHPRDLSAEFIRRKMPRLSAVDVFKNALQKLHLAKPQDAVEGALRFETLHYSRSGAETMPRKMVDELQRLGAEIRLSAQVDSIRSTEKKITSVVVSESSGKEEELFCDALLSTIPLPELPELFSPALGEEVCKAARHLEFKAIVVHALLVKKRQCMKALYTYYRDRHFHRVGEPKNAGLKVVPEDYTTLIVETTCSVGDSKWNDDPAEWEKIAQDLAEEGLCEPEEVIERHHLRTANGYPIFKLGFEQFHRIVIDELAPFGNLRTTGRQGAFTYPNMHKAMRMGADAAEELLAVLE